MRKLLVAVLLCLGCSLPKASNADLINKTSIPYHDEMTRPPSASDGSLWQDRSMVADLRARGVNDLVTIRITESTSAKLKGDLATSRVGANSLKATSYLSKLVPRDGTTASATTTPSSTSTTSTNTAFKGAGTTDRSEVFSSTITTRVLKVLSNGNLIVEGYRDIQLNNETQRLYISGMVNPAQLDTNSSISSSQVAELRLLYGGKGVVDETTKPGYLSRMINLAWPF
jgi:flagellar L-ring protein precursor FlgH